MFLRTVTQPGAYNRDHDRHCHMDHVITRSLNPYIFFTHCASYTIPLTMYMHVWIFGPLNWTLLVIVWAPHTIKDT